MSRREWMNASIDGAMDTISSKGDGNGDKKECHTGWHRVMQIVVSSRWFGIVDVELGRGLLERSVVVGRRRI